MTSPWRELCGLDAYQITEIPRWPDSTAPGAPGQGQDPGRPGRIAALVAAYHAGGAMAYGWMRLRAGGPIQILAAGSALAGSNGGAVVLALPGGARGHALGRGALVPAMSALACWRAIGGISDGLLMSTGEPQPGRQEAAPSLEECLLPAWAGPFGWIVVAEPLSAAGRGVARRRGRAPGTAGYRDGRPLPGTGRGGAPAAAPAHRTPPGAVDRHVASSPAGGWRRPGGGQPGWPAWSARQPISGDCPIRSRRPAPAPLPSGICSAVPPRPPRPSPPGPRGTTPGKPRPVTRPERLPRRQKTAAGALFTPAPGCWRRWPGPRKRRYPESGWPSARTSTSPRKPPRPAPARKRRRGCRRCHWARCSTGSGIRPGRCTSRWIR